MIDIFGSQKVWTNIRKGGDWWADVVHPSGTGSSSADASGQTREALTDLTFMEVPESQDKNKRREGTSLYSDEGGYHEGADEFSESPLMKEIEEEGKKYFDKLRSE